MGSQILRRLCQRGSCHYNSLRCVTNSWWGGRGAGFSTLSVSDESAALGSSRVSPPWLMLPPAFEGGDMIYNFYSLAEDRVKTINKRGGGGGGEGGEQIELPDDDAKLVGSSHGWLALFNQGSNDISLSNPLSHRHIKLPPINTLPDPELISRDGSVRVGKVIISCSPSEDEEECRALSTFPPGGQLAFCRPGHSAEWTPIGDSCYEDEHGKQWARHYQDFVYSSTNKLFFCLTKHDDKLEGWDLGDPRSPRIDWTDEELEFDEENYPWPARSEEESKLKGLCRRVRYLVFAEQSNQLFLVTRHVMERMGPDGSYVKSIYYGLRKGFDDSYPYKTIGFDVHGVDRENGRLRYMEGSLEGLAMFVGTNHSSAMSAAEFPELKPNSIYFTDDGEFTPPDQCHSMIYGGHDIGIFNYESRTFSPCYYPCDIRSVKRIVPAPVWFTPGPN